MSDHQTKLSTIKRFASANPAFSEGSLRWLRFNSDVNGFGRAFKKIGRRVLINEAEFFDAIERSNANTT